MQPAPQEISTCSNCGGVLEETPGGGLGCMSCLLRAGIGSEKDVGQDSAPDAFEDGGRFGVYEIDRREDGSLYELGRGAMGVTYRATDTSLQRKVALKIIKIDIAARSADARERFMREARAAGALRHENIATVHQFGMRQETAQYFYAMELIEGETLEQRVRRAGPLDARTTIGIAEQVTSALAAAEKHGLVHRDLKPANLMLVNADDPELMGSDQARSERRGIGASRHAEIPMVKIIDFGLAKAFHTATDPKSLSHDRFVGTPAFASPEQFEHSALDVRSDLFARRNALVRVYRKTTICRPYVVGDPSRSKIKCASHRTTQSGARSFPPSVAARIDARIRTGLAPRHPRISGAPATLFPRGTPRTTHAPRSCSIPDCTGSSCRLDCLDK
jgi:serine/threonine protein kinase